MSSAASQNNKNKDIEKEREEYKKREHLHSYENGLKNFQRGGRDLEAHQQIHVTYAKLNGIHYTIILSILISLLTFCAFLVLSYIPITKPYIMKLIDTVLQQ
jgi:hypothetical protein